MTTLIDILKGTNVNPKIARRKLRAAAKTKNSIFAKHEKRTSWVFDANETAAVRKLLNINSNATKTAAPRKSRKTAKTA